MGSTGGRGQDTMRQKILAELCRESRTANELAERFGISGTAVRSHLTTLRDGGLVTHRVERRGPGKPTHVYDLTAEGELLLSKGYLPVLSAVLAHVQRTGGDAALETLLRDVGRSLAATKPQPAGSLRERLARGAAYLEELGGMVGLVELEDGYSIQGSCCPLAALSPRVPLLCAMVESMLTDATGVRVIERCERQPRPHCRFDALGAD